MSTCSPIPDPTGTNFKPQPRKAVPLVDLRKINPEPVTCWMLHNAWWLGPLLFAAGWMRGRVFGH